MWPTEKAMIGAGDGIRGGVRCLRLIRPRDSTRQSPASRDRVAGLPLANDRPPVSQPRNHLAGVGLQAIGLLSCDLAAGDRLVELPVMVLDHRLDELIAADALRGRHFGQALAARQLGT